jgi:preprotein translocase subunit SecY
MTMKKENDKKILNSFIKRIAIIICIKIAIIFFFFLRAQQKIQNKQPEIPQGPQFCYS